MCAVVALFLFNVFVYAAEYPSCVQVDKSISGSALKVNLVHHYKDGAIRTEDCNTADCSIASVFMVINMEACSLICSRNIDCRAWVFTKLPGTEQGQCAVKGSNDVSEEAFGVMSGSDSCSTSVWPACIETETVIRNNGNALWFDATLFGSDPMEGCFMSDCTYTDKYVVKDIAECAVACSKVPDCKWWSFGVEDGLVKCWLRLADAGREAREGFSAGSVQCGNSAPEKKSKWTQGENQCWGGGFTEELCCEQKYGPQGNPACWDAYHTFRTCCLGEKRIATA